MQVYFCFKLSVYTCRLEKCSAFSLHSIFATFSKLKLISYFWQNFIGKNGNTKYIYIYIYVFIYLCVFVCVFLFFILIFTSTERPSKWTNFFTFHHQNLHTTHLYFVRTTCCNQQFHFLSPSKYSEQTNHEQSLRSNSTRPRLPTPSYGHT
jgi:hypothetical protein